MTNEQLRSVVEATNTFLNHIQEAGLVEGVRLPGYTQEAIDARKGLVRIHFFEWSWAINPLGYTSQSFWATPLESDLYSIYFKIANLWNLTSFLDRDPQMIQKQGNRFVFFDDGSRQWLECPDQSCSQLIPLEWAQQLARVWNSFNEQLNAAKEYEPDQNGQPIRNRYKKRIDPKVVKWRKKLWAKSHSLPKRDKVAWYNYILKHHCELLTHPLSKNRIDATEFYKELDNHRKYQVKQK